MDALVLIKAVPSVIVGNVEVEVAVLIIVFPGSSKAEAGIVNIESSDFGNVFEVPISKVSPEDIGAAIIGIVIGDGLAKSTGTGG